VGSWNAEAHAISYADPYCRSIRRTEAEAGRRPYLYKGRYEYLAYQEIPASAIISTFTLEDLNTILGEEPDCSMFMCLHLFGSSRNARSLRSKLSASPMITPVSVVEKFVRRIVGIGQRTEFVSEDFIQEMVQVVIQNWVLNTSLITSDLLDSDCSDEDFD